MAQAEKIWSSLRIGELIQNNASWIALGAVLVFLFISVPSFFTGVNFLALLKSASEMGLVAIGETLVILAGGFDLSVAAWSSVFCL